jgi:hypothetical protein
MAQRDSTDFFGFIDRWEIDLNESIWGVAGGMYNSEPPLLRQTETPAPRSSAGQSGTQ